jgi:hypothetical protein
MADQPTTPYGNIPPLRPMKLPSLFVDANGDSYFGEVEATDPPGSTRERIFPLTAWQVWETKPGYVAGFRPVEAPQALAVMSGRLEVTASSGEKRFVSRGDLFLLQDVRGRGHVIRTIGNQVASVMLMTLKEAVGEKP